MTRHEKIESETSDARRRAALRDRYNLPDTSTPEFREAARRGCEAINNSPHRAEDLAWLEAINAELEKTLPPYDAPLPGDPDY